MRSACGGGSAHADAAGAGGDRHGGHLGERAVVADAVAHDLGQATREDVQVVLPELTPSSSGWDAGLFSTSVLPPKVSAPSGATAYLPIEPLPALPV